MAKGRARRISSINNILGILRACQRGIGIAMLPDYLVEEDGGLVQFFGEATRSRSMPISSIRKNSRRSRACRCSATFWSPTRSAGTTSDRLLCARSAPASIC